MTHQAFEYLEIRAAVDTGEETHSFPGSPKHDGPQWENALAEAIAFADNAGIDRKKIFWTIYGVRPGNTVAIGDFTTFEAAYDVLVGLYLPMRQAIPRSNFLVNTNDR